MHGILFQNVNQMNTIIKQWKYVGDFLNLFHDWVNNCIPWHSYHWKNLKLQSKFWTKFRHLEYLHIHLKLWKPWLHIKMKKYSKYNSMHEPNFVPKFFWIVVVKDCYQWSKYFYKEIKVIIRKLLNWGVQAGSLEDMIDLMFAVVWKWMTYCVFILHRKNQNTAKPY